MSGDGLVPFIPEWLTKGKYHNQAGDAIEKDHDTNHPSEAPNPFTDKYFQVQRDDGELWESD